MVAAQSDSADIQVLLEDQTRINKFSRLNLRIKELDLEIDQLKVCSFLSLVQSYPIF